VARAAGQNVPLDVFVEAQKEAFWLMETDSYPMFKRSKEFKEFMSRIGVYRNLSILDADEHKKAGLGGAGASIDPSSGSQVGHPHPPTRALSCRSLTFVAIRVQSGGRGSCKQL
jgi:hypothetical protein